MSVISHQVDYLVVGSGAVGMAFADVLLAETEATILIVDRYAKPGGHWNVAYPFVTLHQPSGYYGVSSRSLGNGTIDQVGLNKGLNELASGVEVSAYFDDVMREQFLPSGRVQYFPMCEYQGDGEFTSTVSGEKHRVTVAKKIVDATHLTNIVPSIHTPPFCITDAVRFMPINDLVKVKSSPKGYTVIGGGKTGIDACLWLLENQVDPDKIRWIMPRDAWLLDRENTQPGDDFFAATIGAQANQMQAIAESTSKDDMFSRMEQSGVFLRIDSNVWPEMFHGATVSRQELAELKRIKNVVRLGRVKSIDSDKIVLDQGEIETSADIIHVDCSASALAHVVDKPVFEGNVITPQTVRSYQPAFSAAFIAHIEAAYPEKVKNQLCGVVPLPNSTDDWVRMMVAFMMNQYIWSQQPELKDWLLANRLDGFTEMMANVPKDDAEKMEIVKRMRANLMPAMEKLQGYLAEIKAA